MGFTINGTGTTFLGVSAPEEDGVSFATLWLTFFYLPVFPLRRQRVIFLEHKGSGFSFAHLGDVPLDWASVVRTYAYCWLLIPLLAATPAVPVFAGLGKILDVSTTVGRIYGGALVIYEIALLVMVVRRHERYLRPPATEKKRAESS